MGKKSNRIAEQIEEQSERARTSGHITRYVDADVLHSGMETPENSVERSIEPSIENRTKEIKTEENRAQGSSDVASADIETTRANIERTRSEMDETIEALKAKLTPQYLADEAKASVQEAAIEKVVKIEDAIGDLLPSKQSLHATIEMVRKRAHFVVNSAAELGTTAITRLEKRPFLALALGAVTLGLYLSLPQRRRISYRA